MPRLKSKSRCAFTLVELLVVISIVALLMALLLPALSRARELSQRIACATQMKQIAIGTTAYRLDYRDWVPSLNNAGHGGIMWGLLAPANYQRVMEEYWPATVRICPTLKFPTATDNFRWMYSSPILGNDYAAWGWMADRTTADLAYTRLVPGKARYNTGTTIITFGQPYSYVSFDAIKSFPLFADLLAQAPTYRRATPHGGSSTDPFTGGSTYRIDSKGGNSLWEDMHVEWHDWPGPASTYDGLAGHDTLLTGVEQYPFSIAFGSGYFKADGWTCAGNVAYPYYFWAKESKVEP